MIARSLHRFHAPASGSIHHPQSSKNFQQQTSQTFFEPKNQLSTNSKHEKHFIKTLSIFEGSPSEHLGQAQVPAKAKAAVPSVPLAMPKWGVLVIDLQLRFSRRIPGLSTWFWCVPGIFSPDDNLPHFCGAF